MKKRDYVTYPVHPDNWGSAPTPRVLARVERMHRDNTATVQALWKVDALGVEFGGFLGYKYRVPVAKLELMP